MPPGSENRTESDSDSDPATPEPPPATPADAPHGEAGASNPAASPPATMEQLRQRHGWPDDFDLPLKIRIECPSVPETIEAAAAEDDAESAASAASHGT